MKWKIVVVGKPRLAYARAGVEEYLKRLRRYTEAELVEVKEGRPGEVEERLLGASAGCMRVALDERGEILDTRELKKAIDGWDGRAVGRVAFLIGGADGLGERVRGEADRVLALGRLTLQHELALVVLLEQLYRVHTMQRGEPYHR